MSQKQRVINLYKTLYFMGKEYPKDSVTLTGLSVQNSSLSNLGGTWFHDRLKKAFLKNKDVKDPKEIDMLIGRGNFVVKELEALYSLRKYRAMKERYYD